MLLYAYPFLACDEPGAWLIVVPLWVSLRQEVHVVQLQGHRMFS